MRIVKVFAALFMLCGVAFLAALPAVAQSQPAPITGHLAQVEGETFKIGTDAQFFPYEYITEDDSFAGFDVEIMQTIAEQAGFDIEWVNQPFDTLLAALGEGDLDAAISAWTIPYEEKRQAIEEVATFSNPYCKADQSLYMRTDLDHSKESFQIGVQAGRFEEAYEEGMEEQMDMIPYDSVRLAFEAVLQEEVDGAIADSAVGEVLVAENPEFESVFGSSVFTSHPYGILVRNDHPELLDAVNAAITTIIDDGTYGQVYEEWFDSPPPAAFLEPEERDEVMAFMDELSRLEGEFKDATLLLLTAPDASGYESAKQTMWDLYGEAQNLEVPDNPDAQSAHSELLTWMAASLTLSG